MKPPLLALLLLPLTLLIGCSDHEPTAPLLAERTDARGISQLIEGNVTRVNGVVGAGALYSLFVPANWNGDLVLYAHGYRDPGPVDLRDQDNLEAIRTQLNASGYAVGYSSFSENGFAVKDGMQTTAQLRGIFASRFSQHRRTYLMGHSLGGLIALGLTERFPQHYAGALLMCGVTGGSQATVDYIAQIRVLFDFFYPGVLPGNLLSLPAGTTPEEIQNRAISAMTASLAQGNPSSLQGAMAMASVMADLGMPIPFIGNAGTDAMVQTLVGSVVYALSFHARGFADLIDRTHGNSPFDNSATVYGSPTLPAPLLAALNAGVQRYSTTPDAAAYLNRYYQPTGALSVPVVTLTNPFDPIAAGHHAMRFRQLVQESGRSHLLDERSTANPMAYGHCAMSTGEVVSAFQHLVAKGAN